MRIVRLHDPDRQPAGWMQLIEPGQFALFAKDLDTGRPCNTAGQPFADAAHATCVICGSLREAQAFAEAAVEKAWSMRVDIFDAAGRANPPLITVMHPSRAGDADSHPRVLRKRRIIAWMLLAAGIPLIGFAYAEHQRREIILPAFLGINMLLAAARLLWFNLGVRETERVRQERLRRHDGANGSAAS